MSFKPLVDIIDIRMDCAALRSDIDKLKDELAILESDIEKIRKSEGRNEERRNVVRLIDSNSVDMALEKYLEDFREHNPEVLLAITLGERIDIKDADGNPTGINSIAATKDGHVLVGGYDGVLYAGSYNEWGELKLGERIDIRDVNGKPVTITSIVTTGDGRILIGGNWGVLYAGSYNDQGELELGERIDIKDADGDPADINSIAATEDGHVLFGGDGRIYIGAYDINREMLKQHLPEIAKKGEA